MASFTALRSQPVVGGERVVRHAPHIRQHRIGGQDVLAGGKDGVDFLLEVCGVRGLVGIAGAVDLSTETLSGPEGMEDALVMDSMREDRGDERAVVLAQIGDDILFVGSVLVVIDYMRRRNRDTHPHQRYVMLYRMTL